MQFLKERGRLLNKLAVSWLLGYLLPHVLLLNAHVSFFNKWEQWKPQDKNKRPAHSKWKTANETSYTLFQNGRHFSILLFSCKLVLLTSLSNVKFKRIFKLERGQKGQFAIKQKNTKMAAILE